MLTLPANHLQYIRLHIHQLPLCTFQQGSPRIWQATREIFQSKCLLPVQNLLCILPSTDKWWSVWTVVAVRTGPVVVGRAITVIVRTVPVAGGEVAPVSLDRVSVSAANL